MHETNASPSPPRGIRGQWVVLAMFLFGIALTATLWFYWDRHTAPFRELQSALAREFPGSRPRVQGGRRKLHEAGPRILSVVLKVDFNPQTEEQQSQAVADRVVQLARQYQDLSRYDRIEIHLFWPEPEGEIVETEITRPVRQE